MISAGAIADFQLTRVPPEFLDDPYPWCAALRTHAPLHALEGGGVFLSRYNDAIAFSRLLARFQRIAPAGTPERDRRVRFRGFRRFPLRVS
jgi:cytochrome P450